ncbi:MAG: FG-GAP-like repeat-containing protein [Reichenbachiella sp.]|uniref:FG-GAP-like repeat-containing protein n=1 Tax=Reichenbachiella sp. TaxID=2184521 RepID=UPI0032667688
MKRRRRGALSLGMVLLTTALFSQVPIITSFNPTSGPIGTEVTINGEDFSPSQANIIYFGGVKAEMLFASRAEIIVKVPAGASNDLISVHAHDWVAYSPSPFQVTFESDGSLTSTGFNSAISWTPGDSPSFNAQADLDGDGLLDIIVSNQSSDMSLSIFHNTSTGPGDLSFSTDTDLDLVSFEPDHVIVADFDGDEKMDIATANSNGNALLRNLTVLTNNSTPGDISMTNDFNVLLDFSTPAIAAADLNADGKVDMVVLDPVDDKVIYLENTSSPSSVNFSSELSLTTGAKPVSVAIADIDGDGLSDIITANADDRSVSILRNTTSGGVLSFETKVDVSVNSTSSTHVVLIGDIDGDGLPDVVTKNARYLTVLRNTSSISNLSFVTDQDIIFNTSQGFPGLGDLNGDGMLDAMVDDGADNLKILTNTSTIGSISFASSIAVNVGIPLDYALSNVSANDMDGDGEPEIVTVGGVGGFFGSPTPIMYVARNLGSGTDMLTFSMAEQTGVAVIDSDAHTIDLEVSDVPDLTNLVATFTTSHRALPAVGGINPDSGVTALDYTNPVTFTVYAEDGSGVQDWIVTVTLGCAADEVNEIIEVCGSYEFDGKMLTNSGTYTGAFLNGADCDSTVTLDLTVRPTHFYENVYATEGYDVDGNGVANTSGQYAFGPYTASTGCDSTLVINLIIEPDTYDPQDFTLFKEDADAPVNDLWLGSSHLADLDQDGDLDLVITGSDNESASLSVYHTNIYFNQGDGTMIEDTDHGIIGTTAWPEGSILVDVDRDTDLDLVVTGPDGPSPFNAIGKLYINDGTGSFTEKTDANIPAEYQTAIDAADVDGDGDQDLMLNGESEVTRLLLNNGSGGFTEKPGTPFTGTTLGTVDFGDVDGDGDQDVFVTGDPSSGGMIAELYINDGLGNFEEKTNQPFDGMYLSTVEFADIDNDDDLDLFVAGWKSNSAGFQFSQFYINDGNGNFSTDVSSDIVKIANGDAEFADLDMDGDKDLIISGKTLDSGTHTSIYINNGYGHFTESTSCFPGLRHASITSGDVDGDTRPDIFISGLNRSDPFSGLYINTIVSNDLTISACDSYAFDGTTLTESGSYQGSYIDEYGCSYPVNLGLTILEPEEVETFVDECGDYEFGTQLLTESGIYTETFTNLAGCDSTVVLTFGQLPEPSGEIEVHGVVLFAADQTASSYQWISCDTGEAIEGQDKRQLTPPGTGNYAVEVGNGLCTATSDCTFFDWVMSAQAAQGNQIKVHPTITSDVFTLDLNQSAIDVNVRILYMDGSVMFSDYYTSFSKSDFTLKGPSGMYLVQVSAQGEIIDTQRVLKK